MIKNEDKEHKKKLLKDFKEAIDKKKKKRDDLLERMAAAKKEGRGYHHYQNQVATIEKKILGMEINYKLFKKQK